MKRTHKGFTLVELLIVVAVIGALAVMMTMSSADAVDTAGANAIMGNLQTLKTAAYQMYIHEPNTAFKTITFEGNETITASDGTANKAIGDILKSYLGKDDSSIIGSSYGLVGNKEAWYVVYKVSDDTAGIKAKLKANAQKSELLGSANETINTLYATATTYYTNERYAALKVR